MLVLAALALPTALSLWAASHLRLRPELSRFLPDDQPSVVTMRELEQRLPGSSNVFVVLRGPSRQVLRPLGDRLADRLGALGPPEVTRAESGVHEARAFLRARAGLFAPLEDLEALRDDLAEHRRRAYAELLGADLSDPDDPEEALAPIDAARIRALVGQNDLLPDHPDGYYESEDGRTLVVVVRSALQPDELDRAAAAIARVRELVRAELVGSDVDFALAGDLVTGLTEYGAIRADLLSVGALGVGLVLAVILLFYLSLRPLVLLGLVVFIGCAWTFGLAQLAIGELNMASGFMFSIVAGNGINCGIIFQSRYLEERGRGLDVRAALERTLEATWRPTLAAALAAAAAYAAMGVTDFRGFRALGFIGATGMLACWIASFAALPALLGVSERLAPLPAGATAGATALARWRARLSRFEAPFQVLVARRPGRVAVAAAALGLVGLAALGPYVARDPMEYNMRNLETDKRVTAEVYRAADEALAILGTRAESAMVVLTERLDQVRPYQAVLRARRDAAPPGQAPFRDATSIFDFVPDAQEAKLPVLREIRRLAYAIHEKGGIADEEWERVAPLLPPDDLEPFALDDLPDAIRRWFRERDGTVGRLVYITPADGKSDKDLKYLRQFATAFQEVQLPGGEAVRGSGRAVVFADLIDAVTDNMGPAFAFAAAALAMVVLILFRARREAGHVLAALGLGLAWLAGLLAVADLKLNFINFVAIPITLGIGTDYALNMVHRYAESGGGDAGVFAALRGVAGPVVLCSLTTTLAYLALVTSHNHAIRGLGLIAVLGEVTCLLAAAAALPAYWLWRARRAAGGTRTGAAPDSHAESPRPRGRIPTASSDPAGAPSPAASPRSRAWCRS